MKLSQLIFRLEHLLKGALTYIKRLYLYKKISQVGENVRISPKGTFHWPEKMKFGNNIFIEKGAHLSCREGLTVGNYVMIGPNVTIIGGDHKFDQTEQVMWNFSKGTDKKIIIEDDVWIGANVTLLKNAHISTGCVIGACSVVTKKTQPYGIYAGNPAKLIRYREQSKKNIKYDINL